MIKRRTIVGCFGVLGVLKGLGVLGVFLLAGCSGEPVVGPEAEQETTQPAAKTAIAFSADLSEEAVTRAATPLETYATSFRVWAYKNMSESSGNYGTTQTVMDQYHVQWTENTASTSTTNSSDWEYLLLTHPDQSIKYWDFGAKAYRFFGSAEMSATPGTWTRTTEEGKDVYKYECNIDATNAADAPFYSHLWFSTGEEVVYPTRQFGKPVTLEFIKPLAEVQFKFIPADPTATPSLMLEDPDFRPLASEQRIAVTGKMTITFPIEGTETQESWESVPDYSSKYLVSFTTPSTSSAEKWYMVLPIRGQGAYKLTVTVNGADKDCTVPAEFMTWHPGYRYTYIFKVNDEGGVELQAVNIGVKDWTTVTPADYNLYNW